MVFFLDDVNYYQAFEAKDDNQCAMNSLIMKYYRAKEKMKSNDMNPKPNISRIRTLLLYIQIKESVKAFLEVFIDILCYKPFVPLIFVKITAILFKHSFCVPDDVYSMVRLELSTFHFYTHYEMTAHLINTSYAFGDDIASSI